MSDNETADLRKLAQQAADRGSLLSLYPTTVLNLITRVERAEAAVARVAALADDPTEFYTPALRVDAVQVERLREALGGDPR